MAYQIALQPSENKNHHVNKLSSAHTHTTLAVSTEKRMHNDTKNSAGGNSHSVFDSHGKLLEEPEL